MRNCSPGVGELSKLVCLCSVDKHAEQFMKDGETLDLSREGLAQGHQTSCPGKRGLEVRRGYGLRVVVGWGSEASWYPGSWDGERDKTTWV